MCRTFRRPADVLPTSPVANLLSSIQIGMLVLFSIAMICFFALFGMMVILLRQAKAGGAVKRRRQLQERESQRASQMTHASEIPARFDVSQPGLDLALSNLVPSKQPDWRFMVRDSSRIKGGGVQSSSDMGAAESSRQDRFNPSGKKSPRPFHYGVDRPDRAYSNKDLGDLTDPHSSNVARRA